MSFANLGPCSRQHANGVKGTYASGTAGMMALLLDMFIGHLFQTDAAAPQQQ